LKIGIAPFLKGVAYVCHCEQSDSAFAVILSESEGSPAKRQSLSLFYALLFIRRSFVAALRALRMTALFAIDKDGRKLNTF
jgi:hypothetical protein